jgi:transcriptional regulator with XRE-family HTH domain
MVVLVGVPEKEFARGLSVFLNDRLKQLRESRNLSQGDIEKKTGLLRCYISRVENGHTVPSVVTLEKMARALQLPLYQIFYDGNEQPVAPYQVAPRHNAKGDWASYGKGLRLFTKIRYALSRTSENDRDLILHLVEKLGHKRGGKRIGGATE